MGDSLEVETIAHEHCLLQIATHNKPYFAAAQGTWDVLQDVSAVLDDNLLGTTTCPVMEVCRVSCA
jgi:hypothetical protein